jgi:hypothetical protein
MVSVTDSMSGFGYELTTEIKEGNEKERVGANRV